MRSLTSACRHDHDCPMPLAAVAALAVVLVVALPPMVAMPPVCLAVSALPPMCLAVEVVAARGCRHTNGRCVTGSRRQSDKTMTSALPSEQDTGHTPALGDRHHSGNLCSRRGSIRASVRRVSATGAHGLGELVVHGLAGEGVCRHVCRRRAALSGCTLGPVKNNNASKESKQTLQANKQESGKTQDMGCKFKRTLNKTLVRTWIAGISLVRTQEISFVHARVFCAYAERILHTGKLQDVKGSNVRTSLVRTQQISCMRSRDRLRARKGSPMCMHTKEMLYECTHQIPYVHAHKTSLLCARSRDLIDILWARTMQHTSAYFKKPAWEAQHPWCFAHLRHRNRKNHWCVSSFQPWDANDLCLPSVNHMEANNHWLATLNSVELLGRRHDEILRMASKFFVTMRMGS